MGGITVLTLGLNSHKSGYKDQLFLCPKCLQEDVERYGEPYWHRSHQLPGSVVCHKHNVMLIAKCLECEMTFTPSINRDLVITPLFCSNGHSLAKVINNQNRKLLLIAEENYKVLNTGENLNFIEIRKKMKQYCLIKGYLTVQTTKIKYEKLYPDFFSEFPESFLNNINVPFDNVRKNWIKSVFWDYQKSVNPLHYILLMIFLAGDLDRFLNDRVDYLPFGIGPWPCLNVTCDYHGQKIIKDINVEKSKKFAMPIGIFQCKECGFTYCRNGPDETPEDLYRYSSIRDTGNVWDAAFKEFVNSDMVCIIQSDVDLMSGKLYIKLRIKDASRDIDLIRSKKVDLDVIEEKTYSKQFPDVSEEYDLSKDPKFIDWLLNNDKEWLDRNLSLVYFADRREIPTNLTIQKRREEFLGISHENPGASRIELRAKNNRNYNWLMSNDKDWLKMHLPPVKEMHKSTYRNITREQRRERFLSLRANHPEHSKSELSELDESNYCWLQRYDKEWFQQNAPKLKKKIKRRILSREQRREEFLKVFFENPSATPKEIRRLCGANYLWLRRYDTDWFREYQPRSKKPSEHSFRHMSIEQRREAFLKLLEEQPNATRVELKKFNEPNYVWLLDNDTDWLKQHLPPIKENRQKPIIR